MQFLRLLLVVAVSATCILAQESLYTVRVDVPLVSVDVTVFDSTDRPVTSLGMSDFQLYENGQLQRIQHFSPATTAYNIVLLFDRSGSTQSQWLLMQQAVSGFLGNLRPQDRVAIAAFDDEFQMLSGWNAPRAATLRAVEQLTRPRAIGGTNFYRSLERVVTREFRSVAGRRAVIVFSDGRDTGVYRRTVAANRVPLAAEDDAFQKTLKAIQKENVAVYFMAVNTDRNLAPRDAGGADYFMLQRIFRESAIPHQFLVEVRSRLEELANISGGRVFFPANLPDVIPLYEQVSRELSSSYSLGYIPESFPKDGSYRRIEVQVRDSSLRIWQSREGYFSR